jgi:hypothetical protein
MMVGFDLDKDKLLNEDQKAVPVQTPEPETVPEEEIEQPVITEPVGLEAGNLEPENQESEAIETAPEIGAEEFTTAEDLSETEPLIEITEPEMQSEAAVAGTGNGNNYGRFSRRCGTLQLRHNSAKESCLN